MAAVHSHTPELVAFGVRSVRLRWVRRKCRAELSSERDCRCTTSANSIRGNRSFERPSSAGPLAAPWAESRAPFERARNCAHRIFLTGSCIQGLQFAAEGNDPATSHRPGGKADLSRRAAACAGRSVGTCPRRRRIQPSMEILETDHSGELGFPAAARAGARIGGKPGPDEEEQ
jgi:hypothetical protein